MAMGEPFRLKPNHLDLVKPRHHHTRCLVLVFASPVDNRYGARTMTDNVLKRQQLLEQLLSVRVDFLFSDLPNTQDAERQNRTAAQRR